MLTDIFYKTVGENILEKILVFTFSPTNVGETLPINGGV
jgi:hypothetical protein